MEEGPQSLLEGHGRGHSIIRFTSKKNMRYQQLSLEHLEKARDSALLAVEFYNKPAVRFKAGGYITMMSIAWTALFHAIFFNRRIKPFYRNRDDKRRFEIRDGDFRYWELKTCLNEFYGDESGPVRANVQFFIPLRNQIEHRSMPRIDSTIFAECQAWLLNFDQLIESEFGEKWALKESLSFSLQLFPKDAKKEAADIRSDEATVLNLIHNYRSALAPDIYSNPRYAFKAFLIRVGNHKTADTAPIQFVDYDSLDAAGKDGVEKFATFIKTKSVPVKNHDLFKPADVVKAVQQRLGNPKVVRRYGAKTKEQDRFNESTHAHFWRHFEVRPHAKAPNPAITKPEFCVYDKLNKNYGYTAAWIDLLVESVGNDEQFLAIMKNPALCIPVPKGRATV